MTSNETDRLRAEVHYLRNELDKWDFTATCEPLPGPTEGGYPTWFPSDTTTVTCRTPHGVYTFEVPTGSIKVVNP